VTLGAQTIRRARTVLPQLGWIVIVGWVLVRTAMYGARWEHGALVVLTAGLVLGGQRTQRFYAAFLPIGLLAVTYDAIGCTHALHAAAARAHVCDLRAAEQSVFGIGGGRTVHDWLQPHATRALDVLCAFPYGTFIFVELVVAVVLVNASPEAAARFGWTFLGMNLMAFATYAAYPAAPPWYFHTHGCAIDPSVHASEGPNLARVDAWLGVRYFHAFYARSSDVFGAMPSMHVAYPVLALVQAWRWVPGYARVALVGYAGLMAFAAIYLDHHWILDVVVGALYAVVATVVVRRPKI
jgi:inositol phosphorylceramide synthase catalytic subunit